MMRFDRWAFAWKALSSHRLRTGLCLMGIAIGVTAVVLLTSLGEGARRFVTGQFQALGTNLVFVVPGFAETEGAMPGVGGTPNDLTFQDARALQRQVRGLDLVVPVSMGSETVAYRERNKQVYVLGATADFLAARQLRLQSGINLPELEWERSKPVIVLGAELARELFREESAVGKSVRVGDRRMRVIGVVADHGQQVGLDTGLMGIVPVSTAMSMFGETGLFRILIQVGGSTHLERATGRMRDVLLERHGEEDFTCVTQESVASSLGSIMRILTLALAGIASVSLGVAGIGIMNVMLVSVSERRPEVGLLRALGASRKDVRGVFLAEAAMISMVGGLLGLGLALLTTGILQYMYPVFDTTPPWWAVVAALLVSNVVGLIFGVLPAKKAAAQDPVVALRS
ncbi:MAG: putative ABC transport system permease protein [Planctomycetota bacterium]|jgi:putative ABC transport system permease protein